MIDISSHSSNDQVVPLVWLGSVWLDTVAVRLHYAPFTMSVLSTSHPVNLARWFMDCGLPINCLVLDDSRAKPNKSIFKLDWALIWIEMLIIRILKRFWTDKICNKIEKLTHWWNKIVRCFFGERANFYCGTISIFIPIFL